jgi:rhamnose utilization protein RhaD (predicted bifunctional aldolase and dehydrogenase)/NAD(P)-dependent dehydrogenase (short-subunit alcohol dehydrogenase family)
MVAHYAADGVSRDLALRVYTSRLLGGDSRLVLHGGGNTSVKTTVTDLLGDEVEVLCVKGSGWDLGDIEPPGLPAVRLEPIRRLLALDAMSDEEMVNAQRGALLDSTAPNPSVETLLHAFLPHKFVDHTHADAVLALVDHADGAAICTELYGDRMAQVPYIMPGFALARKADEVFRANPDSEGLILLKHGIFTYGETASEAYGRMIEMVTLAEDRVAAANGGAGAKIFASAGIPDGIADGIAPAAKVAPILRGLVAIAANEAGAEEDAEPVRFILDFRTSPAIRDYVAGPEVARYARQGPVTPDHAIRTKPLPLIVDPPDTGDLDGFSRRAAASVKKYAADYRDYFGRNNAGQTVPKHPLDAMPRVILVPGLGLFGIGNSGRAAAIAADLAETTVGVIAAAEGLGPFESVSEADIFDIEYWSLEQAKLGKQVEKPLARQIAVITGGASGIGLATAAAFRAAGAEVAILDRDGRAAVAAADEIGGLAVACDVTDAVAVAAAFDAVAIAFGGVDIVVSNAGAAWQGRIGEVPEAVLRESFELNFYGHQRVAQAAVAIMRTQGTGGVLLFNTSKQAINPGPDFGPYGLPKAATLFLMRQYALDHGADGIRANAVNADRIRTAMLDDEMIAARAEARGLSAENYMSGNLLGREVRAADVAQAFVSLALARKTTGAVLTVDGGNIAAALR